MLDGAILVLCAVGGVQSQSMTVDRQMKRYHVPRLAFINKMDRTGANPETVVKQVREKLGCDAVLMQIPIGKEDNFEGVIDLITMKAIYFDGTNGEKVRDEEIPADLQGRSRRGPHAHARSAVDVQRRADGDAAGRRRGARGADPRDRHATPCIEQDFTPVFLGSAYKNKGVQPLLDAIVRYLPSPLDRAVHGQDPKDPDEKIIALEPDPTKPFVGMAFKIVDDRFGQLTFMRIYQGTIKKGEMLLQPAHRQEGALQPHREDARRQARGNRHGRGRRHRGRSWASTAPAAIPTRRAEVLHARKHVRGRAGHQDGDQSDHARRRRQARARRCSASARKTRRSASCTDEETGETVIAGMGELHLEIYVERIRREYKVEVEVGAPKVSYREAPTKPAEFDFKHKKQTGGSGQYAHIVGEMSPMTDEESAETEGELLFDDKMSRRTHSEELHPGGRKGLPRHRWPRARSPASRVVGVKIELEDGSYHDVDSSDMAFQICAQNCFRETFLKMKPVLLEPIMKVEIEVPESASKVRWSAIFHQPPRHVMSTESDGQHRPRSKAEVPLAETFGYSTDLRSMTQGQGTFTMEFSKYRRVPATSRRNHRRTQSRTAACVTRHYLVSSTTTTTSAPGFVGGFDWIVAAIHAIILRNHLTRCSACCVFISLLVTQLYE